MLERAGYRIQFVAADEAHPDCVFIEDTVVVVGDVAVITRPGAPSRRGEVAAVRAALPPGLRCCVIEAPGTLEGGDVFMLSDTIYVGLSGRTNRSGIEQLASIASNAGRALVTVPVVDVLHLKSAVLPLDSETVLVTPDAVDESALGSLRVLYESESERHGASALPMRDGSVLVTASAPLTTQRLRDGGYDTRSIDVSELQAADGGLTCLSVLI
jgi:dimethylargininase